MNSRYSKQRLKTIQGLRSFKDTLPTKARGILNKKGKIFSQTLDNWKYIVGEDFFQICYPKSFKSANRLSLSLLSIMVKRGHEVDMEYSKKDIIEKMNKFFGYNVVESIKLITFEGDQQRFKERKIKDVANSQYIKKISNIKNSKIKNSLLEFSKYFKK